VTMLRFAKYHGLGNDFLVADLRDGDPASAQDPEHVRALCDRRFGVGGDGVLAVLPPTVAGADARMRVLNADGSEAEMCGNGIRCVAKHLVDRDPALRGLREVRIETLAGVLPCAVTFGADGLAREVTVGMGRPRLLRGDIPMTGPAGERFVDAELEGAPARATAVSMGNPHVVLFVDESGPALRALAARVGPALETHAWFPRKTNVELARMISPREIEVVVWERACGITLACGTGASATAVAAALTGRAPPKGEIAVSLLGGDLAITVDGDEGEVEMRGPAAFVFESVVDVASLRA
jgi:diaminopimelate epimerase